MQPVVGYHPGMQRNRMIRACAHRFACVGVALWALAVAAPVAQGQQIATTGEAAANREVPEPAALRANWWDYVASAGPGLPERLAALLDHAGAAAALLPPQLESRAAPSLERLRISLSALPAMLAARPAAPPPRRRRRTRTPPAPYSNSIAARGTCNSISTSGTARPPWRSAR